jgi:hydroxyacylglutathione hydrolase
MNVETFPVGMLSTNCYVANCTKTKEAIIIDPGIDYAAEALPIFNYINKEKLKIKYILNTHGHSDHVTGDGIMQQKYPVPICIHALDVSFLECVEKRDPSKDVLLKDGDVVAFGNVSLKVLHTPGHTMGCICLVGDKAVFSGDTLFAGSIGRTDFAESSPGDMALTLRRLMGLPDALMVYPGHGGVSFMGHEKRCNPFLTDFDSFKY